MDEVPLPQVGIGMVVGLLEMLEDVKGKEDIFKLAGSLSMELDDIGPVLEAAKILGFVKINSGDIILTDLGAKVLNADINERKDIIYDQVQEISLFKSVLKIIKSGRDQEVRREQVIDHFARKMSDQESELLFNTIVDWGRYAEIIGYDPKREVLYITDGE